MSIKTERVREKIKTEVARIIQSELRDPRLGFVTVMSCDLSHDFMYAKIHVSVLADKEADVRKTMRMLEDARGFIQRTVAGRLRTRVTPELSFVLDTSAQQSIKISSMLDDLKREREEREGKPKAEGDGVAISEDLRTEEELDAVDGDDEDEDDEDEDDEDEDDEDEDEDEDDEDDEDDDVER